MLIHVRRRHIERGKPSRTQKCPVALAYLEATGERPRVQYDALYTRTGYFGLPSIVRRFIARFDAGLPVKPFAFVLK